MKCYLVFFLLIIFFLFSFSCKTNENTNYKVSIDNKKYPNLILSGNGKEILKMNFNDDGTLASFSVVNDDREFMVVVNFNQNSIDSFALSDLPSKYSSTSIFDGSDDCKLLTLERIEDLVVKKEILKDGNVKISTSNHVVVSEK